jgi:esterase/lipase
MPDYLFYLAPIATLILAIGLTALSWYYQRLVKEIIALSEKNVETMGQILKMRESNPLVIRAEELYARHLDAYEHNPRYIFYLNREIVAYQEWREQVTTSIDQIQKSVYTSVQDTNNSFLDTPRAQNIFKSIRNLKRQQEALMQDQKMLADGTIIIKSLISDYVATLNKLSFIMAAGIIAAESAADSSRK